MSYEVVDPKQILPGSETPIGPPACQDQRDDLAHPHSGYRGLPPALATPPPTMTRRIQAEPDPIFQSGAERWFGSFIFVDEQERQQSSELRKAVRSHVRKGTHVKQRRLNAASKPGSGSVKKILKRPIGIERRHIGFHTNLQGLPQRTRTRDILLPTAGGELVRQHYIGTSPRNELIPSTANISPRITRHQLDSNTPYSLLLGDGAPLLYLQAKNWPFPQPLRGSHPAVSVWMPSAVIPIPNTNNPRPCLLRSAGTVPWIINSLDYFLFKDEAIRWVNHQLQQPSCGTSDTTMGVIVCLMTWEIARGNVAEITHHMKGLQQIIDVRGNIPDAKHFNWKLQLVDLIVAIVTSSEPRINFHFHRPRPPPFQNPSLGSLQIADSPLYGIEPLSTVLAHSNFCEQSVIILQSMRDLTNRLQLESHHSVTGLTSFDQASPTNPSSISLLRIIHLTSTIYAGAFRAPPRSFSSPMNNRAMDQICQDLEDPSNDDTWIRYPGILLWIILTAGAAAAFRSQLSFFVMMLMRVGTSAVWWGPEEARLSMLRFLWVKGRSEGLESRVWGGG